MTVSLTAQRRDTARALDDLTRLGYVMTKARNFATPEAFVSSIIEAGISQTLGTVFEGLDSAILTEAGGGQEWESWLSETATEYREDLENRIRVFTYQRMAIKQLEDLGSKSIQSGFFASADDFLSCVINDGIPSVLERIPEGTDTAFFQDGHNWQAWISCVAEENRSELATTIHEKVG